jgi:putative transposase
LKKRYTEEQIIGFLKQAEAGVPVKFGGMSVPDAKRLKELEAENAKLKRLLAESILDTEALKAALGRKR